MNSLSLLFVCGSLAVLFSVQYADGIKCYECSGTSCNAENFQAENTQKIDCDTSCFKQTRDKAITRGCSAAEAKTDCKEVGDDGEDCYCNNDTCNGSTSIQASLAFLAVVMVAVAIF